MNTESAGGAWDQALPRPFTGCRSRLESLRRYLRPLRRPSSISPTTMATNRDRDAAVRKALQQSSWRPRSLRNYSPTCTIRARPRRNRPRPAVRQHVRDRAEVVGTLAVVGRTGRKRPDPHEVLGGPSSAGLPTRNGSSLTNSSGRFASSRALAELDASDKQAKSSAPPSPS